MPRFVLLKEDLKELLLAVPVDAYKI